MWPIADVIELAKVGRGTFYRHFADRDALLEAIYDDALEVLRQAAASVSPELAFESVIQAAAPLQREVFPYASALNRAATPAATAAMQRRVAEVVSGPLAEAQRAGRIRDDLDIDDVITLLTMIGGASVFRPDADEQRHLQRAVTFVLDAIRMK